MILAIFSCSQFESDEALATRTCGGCHVAPEPGMLDKNTWKEHVLPRMGAWLGVSDAQILLDDMAYNKLYSTNEAANLIPKEPLISDKAWQKIQDYYINNAPEKITVESQPKVYGDLGQMFDFESIKISPNSFEAVNTLIEFEPKTQKIYVGKRNGLLEVLNSKLEKIDSVALPSTPSAIIPNEFKDPLISIMGQIRPNNDAIGTIIRLRYDQKRTELVVPGLYRPVFMKQADFNEDGKNDLVIGSFGFHIGKLAWYEATNAGYEEHVLLPLPGAIAAEITDINKDGKPDILALLTQGNESVYAFINIGRGQFRPEILLQFPPVYGSTGFGLNDFDQDGDLDIAIAFGDNADYSQIPKPYHGLRIFENDGKNHFKESQFYPLKGAAGVEIADFDGDGRADIAVIANFAEFSESPQRGFVLYLNKKKNHFEPLLSSATDIGRWLVYEHGDFDDDGDEDILLGSHMVPLMAKKEQMDAWKNQRIDLLLLRNKRLK